MSNPDSGADKPVEPVDGSTNFADSHSPQSTAPTWRTREKKSGKLIWVAGVFVVLIVATIGGFVAFKNVSDKDTSKVASLSESSSDKSTSNNKTTLSREEAARKFVSCMRENGVSDFPDPVVDSQGNVSFEMPVDKGSTGEIKLDRNNAAAGKAFDACREYMEALRPSVSKEDQQKMQDAMLAYTSCMRKNGYEMDDPQFSPNGAPGGANGNKTGGGGAVNIDRNDPAFRKADAICRPGTLDKIRPQGVPAGGPGMGGPGR